ncbi:hypothetical protein [Mucilaginibacter celer]|uniref:Uncharacterized protein n=1 Tax=Mucilaginibacter celer TaxID=2305508 RepID=A0A494VN99_9SPHI|nr:hypothetical protein [Mucilaginibacter celer]AYL96144.1 hypothetical protein HYN43_012955 [Mucilaginibacter celer]
MSQTDPFISLLIIFITDPGSDFYLPKLLQACNDPKLEPYTNNNIDLGTYPVMRRDYRFNLINIKVEGISNIQVEKEGANVPRIYINGSNVKFYARRPNTEAPMPQLPAKLKLAADLIITPVGSVSLPAIHVTADIAHAQLFGEFDATSNGRDAETIRITFIKLALQQMLDQADNIVFNIDAKSVFNQMINRIINQDSVKLKLVTELNNQLSSASVLGTLSAQSTAAAIAALK